MVLDVLIANLPVWLLLLGTALIVAEALAPGAHFFVGGSALFFAGLVGLVVGEFYEGTIVMVSMTVAVVVSAAGTLYAYHQLDIYGGTDEGKTSDSASLRGATGRVTERVTEIEGEVKLDNGGFNPYYRARAISGEIAEGERIRVVDPGGGNVVKVEPVAKGMEGQDQGQNGGRQGPDEPGDGSE